MSTRAEQVEACFKYARQRGYSPLFDTHSIGVRLTSDGLLRERLAAYADELEASGDPEEAETKRAIGAALKALLKETGDEG